MRRFDTPTEPVLRHRQGLPADRPAADRTVLPPSAATAQTAVPVPATRARAAGPLIADRGEFVDALRFLVRGHVLVRVSDASWGCQLNGAPLRHSFDTLLHFGLITEFANPAGFEGVAYYRITPRGRAFAGPALALWQRQPLWRRLLVRLTG